MVNTTVPVHVEVHVRKASMMHREVDVLSATSVVVLLDSKL